MARCFRGEEADGEGAFLEKRRHCAHAAALGVPLITRDASCYRSYFPTLELIAPS
jgi:hypothetical protein